MLGEKCGGAVETIEVEPLVELCRGDRVNRFESDSHFEATREQLRKIADDRADHTGVGFHGHGPERLRELRNAGQVFQRYGPAIEEIARVVELQPIGDTRRQVREDELELHGECPNGGRSVDCPAPQVAEGARSEEHTSELQSLTKLVCRL